MKTPTTTKSVYLIILSAFFCNQLALSHASITKISPKRNIVITKPLKSIEIEFNEKINLRFSKVEVHFFSEFKKNLNSPLKINREAAKFSKIALSSKKSLASIPIPKQLRGEKVQELSISLKNNLKSGHYIIIWQIMSADGHPIKGFSPFQIKRTDK